ncbi:hypothetical protein F4677DRAFT_418570 [Hypoxylon crocopeplum]|nr:hypothetical protein F4677DRAFT_418570 [Hypoxylon crocopeplum]
METGLNGLIESILNEIAFSGVRGCSVSAILQVIRSFYSDAQDEITNSADDNRDESYKSGGANSTVADSNDGPRIEENASIHHLATSSKVWGWLVARTDVSVGANRRFNHLSLDEILAFPEEQGPSPPAGDVNASVNRTTTAVNDQQQHTKSLRRLEEPAQQYRPHLHISEERQWKVLAGHGPDLKRMTLFEWKALVEIASTREKGILQGDLVRLSGQDKRSLPLRTEALARKGYIIKQPIILRGCRTSKLWLAQFAQAAMQNRDGLDSDNVDLSKETLTKDLSPVPFSASWNGERLDYLAIAQAFNAIIKAWGVMRYCDVRTKLNIENRVPQMRALAKTSRWFTSIGAATFVAARFANGQKLYKDCVKFVREPTAEEWKVFRGTPSAHINAPSGRLGKRGQASRDKHSHEIKFSPHSQVKKPTRRPQTHPLDHEELTPSLWNRHKPIINTAFDIIKSAGSAGSSNAEVNLLTLGPSYRKYTAALTAALSLPNSQPSHLSHYDINSQLNRLGKTMTYQFFANGGAGNPPADPEKGGSTQDQEASPTAEVLDGDASHQRSAVSASSYTFLHPDLFKFAPISASSLSQINSSIRDPRQKTGRKRKSSFGGESTKDKSEDARIPRSKKPRVDEYPFAKDLAEEGVVNDQHADPNEKESEIIPVVDVQQPIDSPEMPPPRAPGVYREPNNSMDPPGKKGRRKRSVVLTFKCNALKDSPFWDRMRDRQLAGPDTTSSCQAESSPATDSALSPSRTAAKDDSTVLAEGETVQAAQRPAKRGRKGVFRCDKCGKTWKNPNGLEYHLNKSQTACNPGYIPPPPPPPKLPKLPKPPKQQTSKPKPILKRKLSTSKGRDQSQTPGLPQLPGMVLESSQRVPDSGGRSILPPSKKRVRLSEPLSSNQNGQEHPRLGSIRGSIILQDVEAYDVVDHRRRRGNSQVTSPSLDTTVSQRLQTSQGLSLVASNQLSRGSEQGVIRDKEQQQSKAAMVEVPRTTNKRSTPSSRNHGVVAVENSGMLAGLRHLHTGNAGSPNAALSDFNLRTPSLESPKNMGHSTSQMVSQPAAVNDPTPSIIGNNKGSIEAAQTNQPSTAKIPRKRSKNTVGSIRRERTSDLIQHLLDKNGGVFPGQRSLYLAVVSLWVKRHSDIEPPDCKVCQNVVNKMEKTETLKQVRFFFLDDNSKLQECCVLAKTHPGQANMANLPTDPKVVIVKEKMREMFPEPYIPETASLSQEENELFNDVALKYNDTPQSSKPRKTHERSSFAQGIEVMKYPAHAASAASAYAPGSKRPMEDEPTSTTPAKKARRNTRDLDKLHGAHPKRSEQRVYWDTGAVAKYIWNKNHSTVDKWDQQPAFLQDFATGTWSVLPEETATPRPSINEVLSSLKNTRGNTLASGRRNSNGKPKASVEASKENHMGSSRAIIWSHYSHDDFTEETHDNGFPNTTNKGTNGIVKDRFVASSRSASLTPNGLVSEVENNNATPIDTRRGSISGDNSSVYSEEARLSFTKSEKIPSTQTGYWPRLPARFFESNSSSFMLSGAMPDTRWFQRENLPQSARDVTKTIRGKFQYNSWEDPAYGKFLREVDIIERWEQSIEGSQILLLGSIAPDYIFMSLSPDVSRVNMKPITLEWPNQNQYTLETIPDEIKNTPPNDDEAGLPDLVCRTKGRPKKEWNLFPESGQPSKPSARKPGKKTQQRKVAQVEQIGQTQEADVQYKTRALQEIQIQHKGRVRKQQPGGSKSGVSETELIAAYVVVRTLLGGVERKIDIGLILKIFPKFSHSALKKFWPKANRERKTYINALTTKFQSAFLEEYEKGNIAPLDYDSVESYDWAKLVRWATKLQTHKNVHLPRSRHVLEETHSLNNVANETTDWREKWFQSMISMYSRVEATSSEPISIPLDDSVSADEEFTSRARSWVRSICVTHIKGTKEPEEIRAKLLELSDGDELETSRRLKSVVDRLSVERVAARSKGKILGQSLRLHGVFAKHLLKSPAVEKLAQAANFKALLDASFRKGEEFELPYIANDGTTMAVINLQAHSRIRVEAIGLPNIPFGFEPGNYDGRTFPKSYYHFKMRLVPTESYMFDDDLPVLKHALQMEAPKKGPRDEIPIWVDFFGNLHKDRWITYLSMMTVALATKGPLTPKSTAIMLKPFVEPFEAKLIMDWIDGLGLLERFGSKQGGAVREWWWLAMGKLAREVSGVEVS